MLVLLLASALLTYLVPAPSITIPFGGLLALLLMIAGIGCSAAGFFTFKRGGTPVRPGADPTKLVLTGPYRFTRNPMYLGVLLFSVGCLFATRSLWFLAPPILFFLVINFRLIPFEEGLLRDRFGSEYETYRRRVRRWL